MKPSSGANSLHTHTHFLRKCCKYLRQESGAESVRKKSTFKVARSSAKERVIVKNYALIYTFLPMPTPRL